MALMAGLAAAVDTTHLVVQATLQALLQAKVTMEVMVLVHQPMQVVEVVVLALLETMQLVLLAVMAVQVRLHQLQAPQ